jgi:tRNA-2-methylthio-N6-dimethylallyladenosine synthase
MNVNQPTYMILTWGCQMNEDDSQQMGNLLEQMGYRRTSVREEADVILLNTCSVRIKPEQKVRSKLGELKRLKLKKPGLIIGVCGCMAQREGESLLKSIPWIDLVLGTASIYDLPRFIQEIKECGHKIVAVDIPYEGSNGTARVPRLVGNVGLKAFVPVMYGCNNFCTYCIVPYTRGPERSRPAEEIVAEITELVARGCKEVTLLGQNVNSYGRSVKDSAESVCMDFAGLLYKINDIPGLERIRFTTSHPKDLSDRLIEAMASLPKVCEHLHLPLQAGDNEVLRRMGRGYSVEHYISLVESVRERVPGIALTTDVMVGFPGETEEQFRNTLRVMEKVRFDGAFMFAFNARPGTVAAQMDGQLDVHTKRRRLNELINLQNQITLEKMQEGVGKEFEVLVEGPSPKDPSKLTGYTRTKKTMVFPGNPSLTGQLVTVRAVSAHPWGYTGEIVSKGENLPEHRLN